MIPADRYNDEKNLSEAADKLKASYVISDAEPAPQDLIKMIIE